MQEQTQQFIETLRAVCAQAFRSDFMQPEWMHGKYHEVSTSQGLEIVPCDVSGITGDCESRSLQDYCNGTVDDPLEVNPAMQGWCWRMSAAGYLDSTDWEACRTVEDMAKAILGTDGPRHHHGSIL